MRARSHGRQSADAEWFDIDIRVSQRGPMTDCDTEKSSSCSRRCSRKCSDSCSCDCKPNS